MKSIKVAIIGSGPSAFYTAKYLKQWNKFVNIDIFEKLPVPFGLVRFGVAPDHNEVKAVSNDFMSLFGTDSNINFYGNVDISNRIDFQLLRKAYSAVVIATGAQTDKSLHIPGENKNGIYSARQFVNWYNGHPDYQHIFDHIDFKKIEEVTIIGQGNVSLDCARILSKSTDDLLSTDISRKALHQLSYNRVHTINIVGRRGPMSAAYTIKELREITKLSSAKVYVNKQDLLQDKFDIQSADPVTNRPKMRIYDLYNKIATSDISSNPLNTSEKKGIYLKFYRRPIAFHGNPCNDSQVHTTEFEINTKFMKSPNTYTLTPHSTTSCSSNDYNNDDSMSSSVTSPPPPPLKERVTNQLVLKSIGYQSIPLEGVPFDTHTNTFPHQKGLVLPSTIYHIDSLNSDESSSSAESISTSTTVERGSKGHFVSLASVYVTGWAKRGPSGIIGTNITDAKETVETIINTLTHQNNNSNNNTTANSASSDRTTITDKEVVDDDIKGIYMKEIQSILSSSTSDVITWDKYLKIHEWEERLGFLQEPVTAPRIKLLSKESMLKVARSYVYIYENSLYL